MTPMVDTAECTTQCAVFDQTPGSQQKKINIVVRPHFTVGRVISDIKTQYSYKSFELLLQPYGESDLVYLNDLESSLLYEVPGFNSSTKNFLVLLPSGEWNGNVKQRYELPMKSSPTTSTTKKIIKVKKRLDLEAGADSATKTTTTTAATTAKKVTEKDSSESSPSVSPSKKASSSDKEKLSPTKKKIVSENGETVKKTTKLKKRVEKDGNTPENSEVTTTTSSTTTTTAKKRVDKDDTIKSTTLKKRTEKGEALLTSTTKKRIEKDGTVKSPKAKKRSDKEEVASDSVGVNPVVNVNNFESSKTCDAISPTSTTDSTDSCSPSNNNNYNNNIIEMDIENGLLTETTKAIITEQLTQILPSNNRDPLTDTFVLTPVSDAPLSDDDLALGASASPTESEWFAGEAPQGPIINHAYDDDVSSKRILRTSNEGLPSETVNDLLDNSTIPTTLVSAAEKSYVGLVNQAMTCYLNSLLQALYMTPEFRNALYRWEFDQDDESKNIPYQLQKLFLNLQTSPKSSVETTDLTRSFGWDSTEAWQQHDIQELCRVMFDALEHKSKNTKQAHFISNLYEGKMLDYVKCLECNTEKTREDTFLDIPVSVRPFGSQVAYGSIEESLRAFVQPETLDGNNQYSCDNCNKKCDAHKGLKFKSFPYVLTLHLKRFDFDYQTMHRIKLNDRVTFPQSLNLNSFVNSCEAEALHNLQSTTTHGVTSSTNVDDCSVADSGSAIEEDNLSSGVVTTASSSQHENDINDDDEGIDMSSSTDHRSSPNKSAAVERLKQESGPYLYELFAIMIHSGSASGGHYYAYIKDFENNEWFCFNDQSVTPITQEDIQNTFGGSSHNVYYSSVYSSSTNAYMLMYRQVDPKRNESAMSNNDFPDHIKNLLPKLHCEEETRISRLGRHTTVTDLALPDLHKPRVYFYNPSMKKMKLTRIYVSQNFNINFVLEGAHEMLDVDKFAPLERCRLVAYDSTSEEILQSFENIVDPALKELRAAQNYSLDFLLEYRSEDQEFEIYEKNGTTWQVYMINTGTMEIDGPFLVHSAACEQSELLRHSIAVRLHIKEDQFLLATLRGLSNRAFVAYDPQPTLQAQDNLQALVNTQLNYLTYLYLHVPEINARNLEILGIPPYEILAPPTVEISVDVVDAVLMNAATINSNQSTPAAIGDSLDNFQQHSSSRESPLPPPITTPGHESNSEDSSLSDGDRTLVESMQHRGGGDSQVSSTSHSPQLSSPEDDAAYMRAQDSYMRVQALYNGYRTDGVDTTSSPTTTHFFHANKLECLDLSGIQTSTSTSDDEIVNRKPIIGYKIIAGSRMRMSVFKQHIANLIQVPTTYFSLSRKNDNSIPNNGNNALVCLNEGETITVELGKILNADEYKAKIYFMRLANLDNDTGKLPCICEWVYNSTTTGEMARRELVAKLHRIDPSYKTLTLENCRLWLKGGRCPIKIIDNDEVLHNEMKTTISTEYLIQECEPGINPQPSEDTLTIFVRRWHPERLEFDKFQEITLEKDSEMRAALSKISDIETENIAYTKINSHFPCTNISVLSLNGSMSWFSIPATVDKYPLSTTLSGHVYFYKDIRKPAKELTSEERIDLTAKEKARLDRLFSISTPSSYSPRRERGLKIHLYSPQKPNENEQTRKVYNF